MLYEDLFVFIKIDNFIIVLCSGKCYRFIVFVVDYIFIDVKKIFKILCVN